MMLTSTPNQASSFINVSDGHRTLNTKLIARKADIIRSSSSKGRNRPRSLEAVATQEVITKLGPYDVLNGRCAASFNNIGNRRFRMTISINLQRYMDAPTRQAKSKVIKSVVQVLKNEVGARFLKKSIDGRGYVELSDKKFREKVGHALRDTAVLLDPSMATPLSSAKQSAKKTKETVVKKSDIVPADVISKPDESFLILTEQTEVMGEDDIISDNHENVWPSFTRSDSLIKPFDDDVVLFSGLAVDWD